MFDALKNLGSLGGLMKQAQAMQGQMQQMQADLAQRVVTADAAGGLVQATVNGKMELTKLRIDKEKLGPSPDLELLEDVIVAAVAAAQARAADMAKDEMQKLAGGLNLPPGLLPEM